MFGLALTSPAAGLFTMPAKAALAFDSPSLAHLGLLDIAVIAIYFLMVI